jgi:hypothetical protein
MSDVRMLVLGGCNLRTPLYRAAHVWPRDASEEWRTVPDNLSIAGPMFPLFSVGEMVQAVSCYRGLDSVPEYLQPLCNIEAPDWAPTVASSPLDRIDIALIEPTTSIEIAFNGYLVNRFPVLDLLNQMSVGDPAVKALRFKWYQRGIAALDEAVKQAVADELIRLIADDCPQRALIVDLLRNARGVTHDVHAGLKTLSNLLDVPMGVAAYTWRHMPDGRHVTWPAGFHGNVVDSAARLGLPVFEPRPLISQTGVERALDKDMSHYADGFMPIVAKALINFARSIVFAQEGAFAGEDFSAKPESPRRRREALARSVNGVLLDLHRERLSELGPERSGLYEAYAASVTAGRLIGDQERAALEAVCEFLPDYDSYAVMRAGLGELALLIAASGRRVIAFEENHNRRAAIEAGFEQLRAQDLVVPDLLSIVAARFPTEPLGGRVLGIASKLGVVPEAQAASFVDGACALNALLIDPRWLRVAGETRGDGKLAHALRDRGLSARRDYPQQRLSWVARP